MVDSVLMPFSEVFAPMTTKWGHNMFVTSGETPHAEKTSLFLPRGVLMIRVSYDGAARVIIKYQKKHGQDFVDVGGLKAGKLYAARHELIHLAVDTDDARMAFHVSRPEQVEVDTARLGVVVIPSGI